LLNAANGKRQRKQQKARKASRAARTIENQLSQGVAARLYGSAQGGERVKGQGMIWRADFQAYQIIPNPLVRSSSGILTSKVAKEKCSKVSCPQCSRPRALLVVFSFHPQLHYLRTKTFEHFSFFGGDGTGIRQGTVLCLQSSTKTQYRPLSYSSTVPYLTDPSPGFAMIYWHTQNKVLNKCGYCGNICLQLNMLSILIEGIVGAG